MKCEFCDNELPFETNHCPNCGAPCKYLERATKTTVVIAAPESKDNKDESRTHSDFVPMGSADISFLTEKKIEKKMEENAGVSSVYVVLGIIVIIAALIACIYL